MNFWIHMLKEWNGIELYDVRERINRPNFPKSLGLFSLDKDGCARAERLGHFKSGCLMSGAANMQMRNFSNFLIFLTPMIYRNYVSLHW